MNTKTIVIINVMNVTLSDICDWPSENVPLKQMPIMTQSNKMCQSRAISFL